MAQPSQRKRTRAPGTIGGDRILGHEEPHLDAVVGQQGDDRLVGRAHSPRWKNTSSTRPADGAIGDRSLSRALVSVTRAAASATRASAARICCWRGPRVATSIRCRAAFTRVGGILIGGRAPRRAGPAHRCRGGQGVGAPQGDPRLAGGRLGGVAVGLEDREFRRPLALPRVLGLGLGGRQLGRGLAGLRDLLVGIDQEQPQARRNVLAAAHRDMAFTRPATAAER